MLDIDIVKSILVCIFVGYVAKIRGVEILLSEFNFYANPVPVHELQVSIQVASSSPRSNYIVCPLALTLPLGLQGFGGNDVGAGFRC